MQNFLSRMSGQKPALKAVSPPDAWLLDEENEDAPDRREPTRIDKTPEGFLTAQEREAWVYICIDRRVKNFAKVPFRLARRKQGGKKDELDYVDDHPAAEFIANPFVDYAPSVGWRLLENYLCSSGNFFGFIHMNSKREPSGMQFLDPNRVTPKGSANRLVVGYDYETENGTKPYTAESIVPIGYISPLNLRKGLSPVAAARRGVNLSLAAQTGVESFYRNGMRLDGVFSSEQDLGPDDLKVLWRQWRKMHNGVRNFYRTLFLGKGLKWTPMSVAPEDMAWLNQRKSSRLDISGIFGVPLIVAGDDERSTYANYREARRHMWEDTVVPELSFVAEALTWSILRRFYSADKDLLFVPDLSDVDALKETQTEKATRIQQLMGSYVLAPNEARHEWNPELPDVEGGDEILVPLSLLPLSQVAERMERLTQFTTTPPELGPDGEPIEDPKDDEDKDEPDDEGEKPGDKPTPPEKRLKGLMPYRREHIKSARGVLIDRVATLYHAELGAFFQRQGTDVIERITNAKARGDLCDADTWAEAMASGIEKDARIALLRKGTSVERVFDSRRWNSELKSLTRGYDLALMSEAYTEATLTFGLGVGFDPDAARVRDALRRLGSRITRVNETTREAIRESIVEGLRRGYSSYQIAHGVAGEGFPGVSGVFQQATESRAFMIARTETADAYTQGSLAAYAESGVVEAKEWMFGTGPCSSEVCEELDGVVVLLSDDFPGSEGALSGPPAHPNCTCTVLPVQGTKALTSTRELKRISEAIAPKP